LDAEKIERAAGVLKEARIAARVIPGLPEDCRPRNLEEAYAVRDRLIELLDWPVGGWFCACTNRYIQTLLRLDEPYYARLLADFIKPSPATLASEEFPPILLECEFGFRLSQDLPTRSAEYTRAEVESAIDTVHPTIEVVAGHLENWPAQDVFSVIADNGTDGALIVGTGRTDWAELDLINMSVELTVNGKQQRQGTGANVLGDPMNSFVWLVNALSRDGHGMRAGELSNTGTATEIFWTEPGDSIRAEFVGLGVVDLELV
jgi:2-keto-4-pentenoate hydratase